MKNLEIIDVIFFVSLTIIAVYIAIKILNFLLKSVKNYLGKIKEKHTKTEKEFYTAVEDRRKILSPNCNSEGSKIIIGWRKIFN